MRQTDGCRCSCQDSLRLDEKGDKTREGRTLRVRPSRELADLVLQRCRRTRRDPSSSNERRRKVARSWVRLSVMMRPYNRRPGAVKGSEAGDAAVQVVLIVPFDLRGDDLADAQRAAARHIDRPVDFGGVRLGSTLP